MSPNYFESLFNLDPKKYKIIPINWGVTNYYSIKFDGWKPYIFSVDDPNLENVIKLVEVNLKCFLEIYKDTHAFKQPHLSVCSDNSFTLEIAIMENERYESMKERENT